MAHHHGSRRPRAIAGLALASSFATLLAVSPFGAGTAGAVIVSSAAPLGLTAAGCIESFDGLSNGSTAASLPSGSVFDESGTSGLVNSAYGATDGSSNSGDVYSLGATGSTERAFGSLLSGSLTPTLGFVVRNETGATITSLTVGYTLEQWRQGGTSRFDRFDVAYSVNNPNLLSGTYTSVAALTGTAPNGGATGVGPYNGNAAGNRVAVSATITGLSIAPAGTVTFRWTDFNAAGSDDALGIDDLSIVANGAAAPTAACSTGGGPGPTVTKIHTIQGPGATSPVVGSTPTIEGIVIGLDDQIGASFGSGNSINTFPTDRGFFIQEQDADQDADPLTSEGIYVGLSSRLTPLPAIGDRVTVTGTVRDTTSPPAFGQTRMEASSFTVNASGQPLPTSTVIDEAAADAQTVGAGSNPTRSYYETLEGMRVTLTVAVAQSGGTNKFGETFMLPGTATGILRRTDPVEPSLIGTAQDAGAGNPTNPYLAGPSSTALLVDQGDTVSGLTAPLAYSFGNYKLMTQVGQLPTITDTGVAYPFDRLPVKGAGQFRVASFNVENLFPVGGALDGGIVTQAEFDAKVGRLSDAIGDLLQAPDVLAIEEIGDNQHNGQTGTIDSLGTLQLLAAKLAADGYGTYTAHVLEGNDNRGIDVGFLVKSTVTIVTPATQRGGLTAAGTCSDVSGRLFDRPPLFIEVDFGPGIGNTWLVANHFSSKAAPDSCREAQATWLRGEVDTLENAGAQVIVMGDLNAFEDEGALTILGDPTVTSLTNLWSRVPGELAYSFQFNGVLQTLDHALITDQLENNLAGFTYAHISNDYADRHGASDGHKSSDHDSAVLTLSPGVGPEIDEAPAPWLLLMGVPLIGLVWWMFRRRRTIA
jgi:predicted extracellular nuclease